jgi:hypothetical protein
MPAQRARPRISTGRSDPFAVPCAVTASTGGLPGRAGPLLVLPRKRRNLIEIRPDREYAKRLVEAEAAFWQLVKEDRWPELVNDELDLGADPAWREAALRYREVRLRLEGATAEEHQRRATLEGLATARRTYGSGVEVLKSSRKGAVDYTAVAELRGVNLEPYRKPPVAVVKINLIEPH